ncbi:MAG: tRNA pseudouridine(13) synthase TruD [Polyangiaceae bacterium]
MLTRPPRGVIKSTPDDFIVEEIPLYAPSGEGDHLYLRFTKRNLPTDAVVRSIARALGVEPRDVGVAGLKDKVGVTTQTISVPLGRDPGALEDRARALALDGVTIHEARRHTNKLRTGHLAGNRFTIVVRDIDDARIPDVVAALERAGREGAPNASGAQRFGRGKGDQNNAERARAWLRGEWSGPRDGRAKRFLWSSLQSAIFNDILGRRIEDGSWATPLEGDVLQKEDSGGLFLCADVQADRERSARGEVSPTGPMVGIKMRAPEGAPLALEKEVTTAWLGESFDLARVRSLGEGARRPLRTLVRELRVEVDRREQRPSVRVYFVLPKGAYATTVLATAVDIDTCATDEVNATPREPTADASTDSGDSD